MFKRVLVLVFCIAVSSGQLIDRPAARAAQLPHLFCDHTPNQNNTCHIFDAYLLRDQPRYILVPEGHVNDVFEVDFYFLKLAVLSPDFCETFPRVKLLLGQRSGIEIIDQHAFESCFHVERINLRWNRIEILPPDLFKNTFNLKFLDLEGNFIRQISADQFIRNVHLETLIVAENNLEVFPSSSVKGCVRLQYLSLYSNNLDELNTQELLNDLIALRTIVPNGNMFPCSKIPEIMGPFTGSNVFVDPGFVDKSRPFRMASVDGYACVDGQ